jgi:hypothetical protein
MWTHLREYGRKEEAFKIHNESKDSLNVNVNHVAISKWTIGTISLVKD